MTTELIEKHVEQSHKNNSIIHVHFKDRNMVSGFVVKGNDYNELKAKNFWRIVGESNLEQWQRTKDVNLTRLFNGISFTKITGK